MGNILVSLDIFSNNIMLVRKEKKSPKDATGVTSATTAAALASSKLHARSFSNNMQMLLSFLHEELERMPLQHRLCLYTMFSTGKAAAITCHFP